MTQRTTPGIGLTSDYNLGENGWKVGMDANLLKLSVLVNTGAEGFVSALPSVPVEGRVYIVNAGANLNRIAVRDQNAWVFYTPIAGYRVYVKNLAQDFVFSGTSWVPLIEPGTWAENVQTLAEIPNEIAAVAAIIPQILDAPDIAAATAASAAAAAQSEEDAGEQAGIAITQVGLATAQADRAEDARDLSQQYASDAAVVSGVNVPIYASKASAAGSTIVAGVKAIRTQYHSPSYGVFASLVGGAGYARLSKADIDTAGYPASTYFRSVDRFMPDGTTDSTNGGYWVLDETTPTPFMVGAKGDGVTDDTQAFADLLAFSPDCYWPAATYVITTLTIPANANIRTDGFGTVIQQKSGQAAGTIVLYIRNSNVRLALEGIRIIGNIATDTNEQNHGISIRGTGDIANIKIGDVLGENIRGDVVYVGGILTAAVVGVSVGNVIGNNILRNVVSITGGQQISIGDISGNAVGFAMIDVEPNGNSQYCDMIYVRSVRGIHVGVYGLDVQRRIGRVTFGHVDLAPSLTADSTPAYGFRANLAQDAFGLRNVEYVKIGSLRVRDYPRFAINTVWNAGEYGAGDLDIDFIDIENCILVDTTYRALFGVSANRSLRIGGGHARLNSGTQRIVLSDTGGGVLATDRRPLTLDMNLETNGAIAYGLQGGKIRVRVHPAAGRTLQSVRVASTANSDIATLANGATIDGVVVATNNTVLLKNQTVPAENGYYRINAAGPATRYFGMDNAAEFVGSMAYVLEGATNARKYFACTNTSAPVLGTTDITYVEEAPIDAYCFSNCRNLIIENSDILLGRAGIDCTNFSIIGTTWRTTHASVIWNQASLSDGALHSLMSSTFNDVLYALGTYSRSYQRPVKFGANSIWPDSTGKLRLKTTAPTTDTDGTVVGTQT